MEGREIPADEIWFKVMFLEPPSGYGYQVTSIGPNSVAIGYATKIVIKHMFFLGRIRNKIFKLTDNDQVENSQYAGGYDPY